jgi:CBS-domain-containing membrane protein
MLTIHKTLFDLTADDLMSRDVVCIPSSTSLQDAARRLVESGISGAPVVDEAGRCLGVLSQTDLARFVARREPPPMHEDEEFAADWQLSDVEDLPEDEVGRYLTRTVITASAQTPVSELAALMCDARVHRVLITAADGKVVGIVSSLDVLRAVAGDSEPAA